MAVGREAPMPFREVWRPRSLPTGGHKDEAQGPAELGEGGLTWGSSRS